MPKFAFIKQQVFINILDVSGIVFSKEIILNTHKEHSKHLQDKEILEIAALIKTTKMNVVAGQQSTTPTSMSQSQAPNLQPPTPSMPGQQVRKKKKK